MKRLALSSASGKGTETDLPRNFGTMQNVQVPAQPWPDAAFLALFFFGLAQCWLYRKTDHIWCAILNHGLFNLTNLVLLFLLPQP